MIEKVFVLFWFVSSDVKAYAIRDGRMAGQPDGRKHIDPHVIHMDKKLHFEYHM